MMRILVFILCFIGIAQSSLAQFGTPRNENSFCNNPIEIDNPTSYCSGIGEYDNENANASVDSRFYDIDDCWSGSSDQNNDVWFKFTAVARAANIVIDGAGNGGTLLSPQVSLYLDNGCFGQLSSIACGAADVASNVVNLFRGGLVIGQSYLIRVDGQDGEIGSFKLCVNNFNPPVNPGQDCGSASVLCDKSSFVVQSVTGSGLDPDEGAGTCISGGFGESERQSTWFTWTAANNGNLSFTITPLLLTDDIDWVLFELPGGIDDCVSKIAIRCNATFGGDNARCGPLTGMNDSSTEFEEDGGCDPGEDGFVRSIDMIAGVSYALLVNNWTESGVGFQIDFGGSGEFLGPEPEFTIDANLDILLCDTEVRFIDESVFNNGTIVSWDWNFGVGATPVFGRGNEIQTVVYESFGTKLAALTVETDRGCVVTKTFEFDVQACCDDFSDLSLDLDPRDLQCAGIPSGSIMAQGVMGTPNYQYSEDGVNFSLNPVFENLDVGDYTIFVRDIKGCISENTASIGSPLPLIVEAGMDMTTDLGIPVNVTGSYSPPESNVMLEWTPNEGITCLDAECLDVEILAPGTTTYTLRAINAFGCEAEDDLLITVNTIRDYYAPNVISTTGTVEDNFFKLYTGPAGAMVDELIIFDRWGSKVYEGTNLPLSDNETIGWDGRLNGQPVKTGVYAWIAKVRYVDNEVLTYSGDVTVLR